MPDVISCKHCGQPVEQTRDWRTFCSARCRARAWRLMHAAANGSEVRTCSVPETAERIEQAKEADGSICRPQKPERDISSVQSELERIWPDAKRLDWRYERIWNPNFWPHSSEHPRGLASILQPGDIVADVTEDSIRIIAQGRHPQRFIKSTAADSLNPAKNFVA